MRTDEIIEILEVRTLVPLEVAGQETEPPLGTDRADGGADRRVEPVVARA